MFGLNETLSAVLCAGFQSGFAALGIMMGVLAVAAVLVMGVYFLIAYFLDQFGRGT